MMEYTLPTVVHALHTIPLFRKEGLLRQPKGENWVDISTLDLAVKGGGVRVPIEPEHVCHRQEKVCTVTAYHALCQTRDLPKLPEILTTQPFMTQLGVYKRAEHIYAERPLPFFQDTRPLINGTFRTNAGWFTQGEHATSLFHTNANGSVAVVQYGGQMDEPPGDAYFFEESKLSIQVLTALWSRTGGRGQKYISKTLIHPWTDRRSIFTASFGGAPDACTLYLPLISTSRIGGRKLVIDLHRYLSIDDPAISGTINMPTARKVVRAAKSAKDALGIRAVNIHAGPQTLQVMVNDTSAITGASVNFLGTIPLTRDAKTPFDKKFDPTLLISAMSGLGKKADDITISGVEPKDDVPGYLRFECAETQRRSLVCQLADDAR